MQKGGSDLDRGHAAFAGQKAGEGDFELTVGKEEHQFAGEGLGGGGYGLFVGRLNSCLGKNIQLITLKPLQHFPRPRQHRRRQAGELGDGNAIRFGSAAPL